MFYEECSGKMKFRAFPKPVHPRILSLQSIDYFGTSEHYWVVEKKIRIIISKICLHGPLPLASWSAASVFMVRCLVNDKKCKLQTITRKRKPICASYEVNGSTIKSCEEERDLDVSLDCDLTLHTHVSHQAPRANKLLRANACNFRKSVDRRDFFNFFIFCPNNLYSTLISKIYRAPYGTILSFNLYRF